MPRPLRVLIVEDRPDDAELVVLALRRAGFSPDWKRVDTESAYAAQLSPDLDIILSDYSMPTFSGSRALEVLHERGLEVPFILISGTIGEDTAVEAMRDGAADYLLKDRLARLGPAVEQAVEKGRLLRSRQQTETALRESEERFRQLAENIQEVFWLSDISKDQMLYVSPAYETVWGRTCDELYAHPRSWLDAIHADDRAQVARAAADKQSAGTYDEEYRIIRPDGTVRWIRDRAFPIVNVQGRVDRVAGVARDVTERKQSEQALKESERRFREMLENVELIAMTLDRKGTLTFCNDCLLRTTGWSREEVMGADWFSKFVPCEEVKRIFFETLETGALPPHYENPILTKDGQRRDIAWNNTVLRDAAGQICGSASIGQDVTERKRAEERIREQAAMLDRAHDAIIVRGFQDRRISYWNKGAENIYGWTAEEAVGRHIGDLIFADPERLEGVNEQLSQTGEWRGEIRHVMKCGKELTISTRATLVRDAGGLPVSVLAINTDITAQKNLEARFLRAQRMESIGTLASGVAHDLNNILAPIMMSVPVLRRTLSAEQREGIISTIEISAERGAQIVKQVLAFGRGLEGERTPLKLDSLIRELAKIMRETFPRNLTIEGSIEPDLWPVLGDATQLHQVVLNLCVNARDAMPSGGKLRLHVGNLDLDASYASMIPEASPGPHVLLEVRDTGTGIPPETVERIFDPFFTTKSVGKGTGLGLSTVLGIVKSHGGFIQVSTELGKGTTFQVYFPASPGHEAPASGTVGAELSRGRGELVLVVDDEASVREAARIVLETAGYSVLPAADGTEALAVFAMNSARVALVLTDLMMPFMDGVALIRALRALAPDLPIIASTGLGEKAQIAHLKAMNVEIILHKPYGADTLLRSIHEAMPTASSPRTS